MYDRGCKLDHGCFHIFVVVISAGTQIAFKPEMPQDQSAAIRTVKMGNAMKVIIKLSKRSHAQGSASFSAVLHVQGECLHDFIDYGLFHFPRTPSPCQGCEFSFVFFQDILRVNPDTHLSRVWPQNLWDVVCSDSFIPEVSCL